MRAAFKRACRDLGALGIALSCVIATGLALTPNRAIGEMISGPVSDDGGPVSSLSANTQEGSLSVHDYSRSMHDMNYTGVSAEPVRASVTGDVLSGPVSELSAGSTTVFVPVAGSGTFTDGSAGAVEKDIGSPLGAPISRPVRDLTALQQQLRMIDPLPREPLSPAPVEDNDDEAAQYEGPSDEQSTADEADVTNDRLAYTEDEATDQLDLQDQKWFGQTPQTGAHAVEQPEAPAVGDVEPPDEIPPSEHLREDNVGNPPPVVVPPAEQ